LKKTFRKKLNGKNILIVGGAGFIGSHLADILVSINVSRLVVVDNLSVGKKENLKKIKNKIIFKKINAENYFLMQKIVSKYKIDYIFNLATIALPFSFKFPRKTFESNIPAGGITDTEKMAQQVLYLCSPAASVITGDMLIADGGEWLVANNFYQVGRNFFSE